MSIDIGLSQKALKKSSDLLLSLLYNYYILMIKSQNYHWNVQTPHFKTYHEFFEFHYKEVSEAIDMVAERVRTLGFRVPATYQNVLSHAGLKEDSGELTPEQMIETLVNDHEYCIRAIRKAIQELKDSGDEGTIDLLVEFLRNHEKVAWMTRSHLNPM